MDQPTAFPRRCMNCGSEELMVGHDILEFGLQPVRDPQLHEFYRHLATARRALLKWLEERQQSRMLLVVLAMVAAPMFAYFHVWGLALTCWIGALVGMYSERDSAFRDGVFCGTRKGAVLSSLDSMVFCRSCGHVLAPYAEAAVESSPEAVERLANRWTARWL